MDKLLADCNFPSFSSLRDYRGENTNVFKYLLSHIISNLGLVSQVALPPSPSVLLGTIKATN